MAAWFDRPATTFAEAPFEVTATGNLILAQVSASLISKGIDPAFSAFLLINLMRFRTGINTIYGGSELKIAIGFLSPWFFEHREDCVFQPCLHPC